jgi:hypothetical protein
MRRPSRCLPVLAALLAGGCGSSAPSTQTSRPGLPSDPTRAARQALAALSDRAFDERFTQVARLHLTGLAPAKAAKLNAGLRSVGSTETGVVRVTDVRDFEGRFTRSDAGTSYVKASGGSFLVSSDGVHYRPGPAGEQQSFDSQAQAGLSLLSRGVTDVRDKGVRTVNGVAVEEYTGVFAGSAVRAAYGSLVKLPAGTSLGRGTITLDVSRAADLPMHMVDVTSLTTDLAALHQPGLSGRLITVVTSTREFTHLGSPS